ncbi:plexin-A2-like isoform X3 [Mytilus californianus]|uniref:plexin-A2-like isoform X3 n=1 Tax=Mytilus californianus TaxID=6549 RepID=UPI0022457498|nr:plexin-A2-like isoform X3 [Mytilus californianus]
MPSHVLYCLGIIVVQLASEYSCDKYTSDEKFRNLAVASDYVYIGGEKNIIQLNSTLDVYEKREITDFPVNWLLDVHNNKTLIACNYRYNKNSDNNLICLHFAVGPNMINTTYEIGLNTESLSAKYISTKYLEENSEIEVLFIASSSCFSLLNSPKCRAISGWSFPGPRKSFTEYPKNSNDGREYSVLYLKDSKHVSFKTVLQKDTFIYFLFKFNETHSKLGKQCTSRNTISKMNSYEDTPIICTYNTKVFTEAQDAVFWKDYLFVAFADDVSSVICRYKVTDIKTIFKESRQERIKCPSSNLINTYFANQKFGDWCYNKSTGQCDRVSINPTNNPCRDVNSDFCNSPLFGSIEGSKPITEERVIYSEGSSVNGAIVKLGVLPFLNHAVIYAGTKTGKIGKIFVTKTDSKALGRFKIVQNFSPVLDIKILEHDVYVMTEHTVINVADKDPCPNTNKCQECMKSMNPACGWNIYSYSSNCVVNPDATDWWLPSVGGQCITIKAEEHILDDDTSNGGLGKTDITFKLEPVIDNLFDLKCQYTLGGKPVTAKDTGGIFICENITVAEGPFQLNVTFKDFVLASTYIKFNKCSNFTSCNSCVTGGQCSWCLKTCKRSTTQCQKYVNETDKCPRITSTKVLIHQKNSNGKDDTEDISVGIAGTEVFGASKDMLKCVVGMDSYNVKDFKDEHVVCEKVKVPSGSTDNKLYLKYNETKLDNSVALEVYDCKSYRDCVNCIYRHSQGYKCKWCGGGNNGNGNNGKGGNCQFSSDGSGCPTSSCQPIDVELLSVYPDSGPEKGGTNITISNIGIGNPGDNTTVKVNGIECTEAKVKEASVVNCKTGGAFESRSVVMGINITINSLTVMRTGNLFTYKKELKLIRFYPQKSIQAGGKKITIVGDHIGFSGSVYNISFCSDGNKTCIPCRYIEDRIVNTTKIRCKMGKSVNDRLRLTNLYVTIDDNTELFLKKEFEFVPNPTIKPIEPESGKVFRSGGSKITIKGSGFDDVGEVRMDNVNESCSIETDSVVCKTPPFVKSDFNRRKRATGQNVFIHFDDYSHLSTLYYVDDPTFSKWSNVMEYEEGENGAPIVIEGRNFLDGAKREDYIVNIGLDGKCYIEEMTDWNITCLPPKNKPRTNHSDENIVFVIVQVGRIHEKLGNIKYITALPILAMVIGILGGLLVVAVVLGSALVLVSRRKRKIAEKNFQMELVNMEDKIRETSREEFADAQMTIRDIKSDLVTSRVPYCDYQSYAFHQLFPNQDMDTHPILFEPMVTDDNRRKVQKAMDMFDKLMTNKLFMKSLVQTLESQNKLSPQDKAQFASLLSVCVIGNMKLFYQLINSLLIDMIKSANKKQQKVLFRRFESITQRLMVNWLALSLYDHLKKNGGMQLFMLYKATQTVIEKAPIDAVTILCKNTLAEERLLKNRVEHETLTLDIDLNGNSDKRIPVIVLDCDTITQVKKKCCTAIYKNQPASEIPTPDDLELEWHSGKSGKLTLQDIDSISDRSNGMVRLNTLKHYMVKDGSVMALMYKESTDQDDIYVNQGDTVAADGIEDEENQHVQGSIPTSPDHVKLLIPETTTDNQELKWHLVACSKNNCDVENFPEKSNLPDEEKSNKEHEIGEIFLNRLFHTKLILRDYIEACFEGITDSQSLSIPVRYFLCMIDKQGKEVGVDGDILQSWKSECYATRVWASLIAKPQILFDVNVPSHVEPCMDILKQVFIDSFTQCPQHVTKVNFFRSKGKRDASTQKLLFCKDIPEYRKNVNSFFIKVEAVNDQEFWTAMDEISKEQTIEMKFSRQATLHQLYKFIAKYKDEIIEDFQEKDETKDLAFGNKLEEVIYLMEES